MAEEKEPSRDVTRRELAEALTRANELIAQQAVALEEVRGELKAMKDAPAPGGSVSEAVLRRELENTQAQLRDLTAAQSARRPGAQNITPVPYKGMVKARERCHIGHIREAGEVFYHEVPALWTDDPFEAVTVVRTSDTGEPVTEPNADAPTPIDFRFRNSIEGFRAVTSDPNPRRAADF